MNRVVDVRGRVVGDLPSHAGGQFLLDLLHLDAHALDHIHRVRVRQHPDAHKHRFLARETHFGIVVFRAEHHIGHIAQAHELIAGLAYDEIAKFFD